MSILVNVFVSDTLMGIESIRLTDFGFFDTYSCFLTQVEQDFYLFIFYFNFWAIIHGFLKVIRRKHSDPV